MKIWDNCYDKCLSGNLDGRRTIYIPEATSVIDRILSSIRCVLTIRPDMSYTVAIPSAPLTVKFPLPFDVMIICEPPVV